MTSLTSRAPGLVADIGGTHARFALVSDLGALAQPVAMSVAAHASPEAAIGEYLRACGVDRVGTVCLAVAGPVLDGHASITNGSWVFDADALAAALAAPVHLINDFYAQAAGLPTLGAADVERLGGGEPGPGIRLVLGPGTGLGVAAWLPAAEDADPNIPATVPRGAVLPTELGHSAAAASNPLEHEIIGVLLSRFPEVTWEHVINGPGLANVYWAMGQLWGEGATELVTPEQVTERAFIDEEPLALHTLEVYVHWLGSLAGNLALTFLPRGGVFLTGAMVARLSPLLRNGGFRRGFEERAHLRELVRSVPTARIIDLDFGLRGAARCLPVR